MRTLVLVNLLNKLPSISSLFDSELNELNNMGAQMLDSIYHMMLKLFLPSCFWFENLLILT